MGTVVTLSIRTPKFLITPFLTFKYNSRMHLNFSGWVANRMDPDQTLRSVASDLGLYCSLRTACPNTQVIYNILYITRLIKESHCNRIWLMTRHISVYAFRTLKAVSSLYKKRCRWRVENKCLDQTVRTDRLIWICCVRISDKGLLFSCYGYFP